MNYYIDMHASRLTKYPHRRTEFVERAVRHYCGLTLQRNFGESNDAFDVRKPDIAEFGQWIQTL